MMKYRLTPAAQNDLSSMWDYTEIHWGADQAERYISEIRAAVERVAEDPRRGRNRDELCEGYFSYAIMSHILFYRIDSDAIDIIRILHQRMDPAKHI